jgi:hypothetical protein
MNEYLTLTAIHLFVLSIQVTLNVSEVLGHNMLRRGICKGEREKGKTKTKMAARTLAPTLTLIWCPEL